MNYLTKEAKTPPKTEKRSYNKLFFFTEHNYHYIVLKKDPNRVLTVAGQLYHNISIVVTEQTKHDDRALWKVSNRVESFQLYLCFTNKYHGRILEVQNRDNNEILSDVGLSSSTQNFCTDDQLWIYGDGYIRNRMNDYVLTYNSANNVTFSMEQSEVKNDYQQWSMRKGILTL